MEKLETFFSLPNFVLGGNQCLSSSGEVPLKHYLQRFFGWSQSFALTSISRCKSVTGPKFLCHKTLTFSHKICLCTQIFRALLRVMRMALGCGATVTIVLNNNINTRTSGGWVSLDLEVMPEVHQLSPVSWFYCTIF